MRRFVFALAWLGLCLLQAPAQAATFAEKNLAQLAGEAEQIFIGTVGSLRSRKLANGAIVTDIAFSGVQTVKGSDTGANLTLLVLGGEVDGLRLEIPGLPYFRQGARYLVFSAGNGRDMFPVVGGPAGFFQIDAGQSAAEPIALRWSGEPIGPSIAAEIRQSLALPAQDPAAAPVTLKMFLAAIQAKLGQR